ncbi:synaptogenesis protein syg-2-like [Penaeus japonicus]|uniref:synaptogenesis protein syg-2-like n=1 Tax=Penaeus japonicus TaxID=27405 RepID=UPI001C70F92A|nr:synaptogenesis protein syg-2-like [Penaeus japonicus]
MAFAPHQDVGSVHTEQVISKGVGVAKLSIGSASRADTGVYLCRASNPVGVAPPATTSVIVTQKVMAANDVGVSRETWAVLGGIGRLECYVRAAPQPNFVWSRNDGLTLLNSGKYTIHETKLVDELVLWQSVLEVRDVTQQDYNVYRCIARNDLGADTVSLALHPPARPHAPANFTVRKVTHTGITLSWTPISEGGPPAGYVIRLRPRSSHEYQGYYNECCKEHALIMPSSMCARAEKHHEVGESCTLTYTMGTGMEHSKEHDAK